MIENRDLAIGTRLVGKYKKQAYTCTVDKAEDGEGVVFVLEDGRRFTSTSAAATAITGIAQNGWRWWSLAPVATEAAEANTLADTAPKASRAGRKPRAAEEPNAAEGEQEPVEAAAE